MFKTTIKFFDKLEDRVRAKLSHFPIIYAFMGGAGVVLFWRGVWHTADFITDLIFSYQQNHSIDLGTLPWWDGPLSLLLGSILLLSTGLFVSSFIGNEIIISGLKGEKKLTEKTEEEVKIETGTIKELKRQIDDISSRLGDIQKDLENE